MGFLTFSVFDYTITFVYVKFISVQSEMLKITGGVGRFEGGAQMLYQILGGDSFLFNSNIFK